jgi:hypothetical protein
MSAKVDQFCDKLRDRLDSIEGRVESFKTNVQTLPERTEKTVRTQLDQARMKVQDQKDRFEQTRANLKARAEQKVADTKEAVSEWKAKHETRKLNARAERSEAYAADAIDFALASLDEAEEAILDAVVARLDADAAQ